MYESIEGYMLFKQKYIDYIEIFLFTTKISNVLCTH